MKYSEETIYVSEFEWISPIEMMRKMEILFEGLKDSIDNSDERIEELEKELEEKEEAISELQDKDRKSVV